MIIFIYGADSFRSRQKLNEIVEHYKQTQKSGLNLKFFEANEADFDEVRNIFRQTSMIFKEKKLVVLKDVLKNKLFCENFTKKIDSFVKISDDLVFWQREGIKSSDIFFKLLKKKAECYEFELLEGLQLKKWISDEFGRLEADVDSKVVDALSVSAGPDLWLLSNEIKKLASFKQKGKITMQDFNLLVKTRQIEANIFKTIDAIASKDKKLALQLINRHLEKGDNAFYVFSMIGYQVRNLLSVSELMAKGASYNEILRITKLNPFVLKKTYLQAKKFSFELLKKIYGRIFETDLDVKTGKAQMEQAIDLLIAEL